MKCKQEQEWRDNETPDLTSNEVIHDRRTISYVNKPPNFTIVLHLFFFFQSYP